MCAHSENSNLQQSTMSGMFSGDASLETIMAAGDALEAAGGDVGIATTGEGGGGMPNIPDSVKANPRFTEFTTEMPIGEDMTKRVIEMDRRYEVASELQQKKILAAAAAASTKPPLVGDNTNGANGSSGGGGGASQASRRDVAVTPGGDNMLLPNQQFALINMASRHLNPRSKRPALRILGLFESPQHAHAHASKLHKLGATDVDLHMVPAQRPFLIPTSKTMDAADVLREITARQSEHAEFQARGETSLRSNVTARKQGDTGTSAYAAKIKSRQNTNVAREQMLDAVQQAEIEQRVIGDVLEERLKAKAKANGGGKGGGGGGTTISRAQQAKNLAARRIYAIKHPDVGKAAADVRKAAKGTKPSAKPSDGASNDAKSFEIPFALLAESMPEQAVVLSQRFAVVAFLLDYSERVLKLEADPMPAACVYAAFASVDEAEQYIEKTAGRHETQFHLDVVEMYQWLHPEDVDDNQLTEVYRDPELNKIMNARKREKQRLEDFDAFCKDIKQETPVTEIEVVNRETGETKVTSNVESGWKNVTLTQQDSKTGEPIDDAPVIGRRVVSCATTIDEMQQMFPAPSAEEKAATAADDAAKDIELTKLLASADASQDRLMAARTARAKITVTTASAVDAATSASTTTTTTTS